MRRDQAHVHFYDRTYRSSACQGVGLTPIDSVDSRQTQFRRRMVRISRHHRLPAAPGEAAGAPARPFPHQAHLAGDAPESPSAPSRKWTDVASGVLGLGLVGHDGGSARGEFAYNPGGARPLGLALPGTPHLLARALARRPSGRRRGHPGRPPTPPDVRFRIWRLTKPSANVDSVREGSPVHARRSSASATPRSCATRQRSTRVHVRWRLTPVPRRRRPRLGSA